MSASLDALDPQLRRFVEDVCEEGARLRAGRALDWPQRREIAARVRAPWCAGGPAMRHVEDHGLEAEGQAFRVRVLRPDTAPKVAPALFYIHGGGWCMFSIDTHDRLLRSYAHEAGVVVVAIDYALSPEHRYPLALRQCVVALAWLREQAGTLGIDAGQLALGGDSAGGNLAVATALRLRQAQALSGVRALLLNYGAFDTRISAAAARLGTPEDLLTVAEMEEFWTSYLGPDAMTNDDPLAQPLRADLHGLPPALLLYGDRDVLGEQSVLMAQRLREAGGQVELRRYLGAPHSFVEAMAVSEQARAAVATGAAWLRRHLVSSSQESVA
ncbi:MULTISPECIES: alpha/beta hydrolase [Pseudoxanthomonas]|jgi:acetyl esterase|uniref:Alpha/beta hydrolase n=1 Tax=Pseudoxanthomonas winnipegensis TaxID=2480810 RepID=A0A4Q8LAX8_9GAMM|nr:MULTISPECIES: alpha/beta hydrolase [Pseudoxanthomonas]TAA25828.1 alpha/beta hydrolase [Pseudoxanthomonas winnipegensis]TMN20422.1 alpha/beta hydrolase [Pseudoxanthomonas sp. X-1]UAY74672.1 alpha/beta hydrolase [Pseudoxanthomonas sp. X-1]